MKYVARNKLTGETGYVQVMECNYLGEPTSVTVLVDPWVYKHYETWLADDIELEIKQ